MADGSPVSISAEVLTVVLIFGSLGRCLILRFAHKFWGSTTSVHVGISCPSTQRSL